MNISKKELGKSQIELIVELTAEEFKPFLKRGAEKVSKEVKIEGFRPGHVPYEILKSKIGEMTILEEAAKIAVSKTADGAIKENATSQIVGQPEITITKLAPDNPLEYKITLAVLPEIKLGDYKNVKVKMEKAEVDEKEVEKLIEQMREMKVKEAISEKEAGENDRVIVDIDMFLDNVPVDGGQGKEVGIIMGKDYIIPGFDKKIIGAKAGEVKEFSLLYPADHYQANLAGKMVDFRVKIKQVYERQLPAVDSEFVKNFGLSNVDEFKQNIKKGILNDKTSQQKEKAEIAMLDKLVSQAKFGDLPEILVKNETNLMLHELEHSLTDQGGKFEDYLTHLKKTRDQLALDLMPQAVKRVKTSLLIREVAVKENIKVDEKEINKAREQMLKQYHNDKQASQRINSPEYENYLANMLTSRKVIEKLSGWNVENRE